MVVNIVYLAVLLAGSVFGCAFSRRRFEETMAVGMMTIVAFLFLMGLLGVMNLGCVVLLLAAVAAYAAAAVRVIRGKDWKVFLGKLCTPALWVFVIAFFALTLLNNGRVAKDWDEYSHWMDIVKVMTIYGDFGTNPIANSYYGSYPPGMALFQYFFQKLRLFLSPGAAFSEWRVYLSYQLFVVSMFLPFLKDVSLRRPVQLLLKCSVIFLAPLAMFPTVYSLVYIDPVLGILSGVGLAMVFLWEEKDGLYTAHISLLCVMLVLMKDVGTLFGAVLAVAYGLDRYFREKDKNLQKVGISQKINWGGVLLPLVLVGITKLLWSVEVKTSGITAAFDGKIDLPSLLLALLGREGTYRQEVLYNFLNGISADNFMIGAFDKSALGLRLNCVQLLAVFGAVSYLLWRLCLRQGAGSAGQRWVLILQMAQCVAYILGLGVAYMYKYVDFEALGLASISRYLGIVFQAGWIFLLLVAAELLQREAAGAEVKETVLLLALVLLVPQKGFYTFAAGEKNEAKVARDGYLPMANRIMETTDGDSRIFVVAQRSDGYAYYALHYLVRPNRVDGQIWSLGDGPLYEGDIWTTKITAQQWQEMLLEGYDYVALYHIDEGFAEHFGSVFAAPEDIQAGEVYRVNRDTGLLEKGA